MVTPAPATDAKTDYTGAHTTGASGELGIVRRQRPLSPHLMIYKPIPTMIMSIMHRATGIAMYFGTLLVAWWLIAAASGPVAYDIAAGFFASPLGLIVLFGYTWVLVHHMLGGIKHLVWDTGAVGPKEVNTALAIAQPIASLVLTVLIWIAAFVL